MLTKPEISPAVIDALASARTAPLGKLWALRGHIPVDLPVGAPEFAGLVVSRQLARETGWPKPESYPDWPGYPRSEPSGPHACMVCGEKHLTADRPRHADWLSQSKPSESVAPESVTSQSVGLSQSRCEVCNKPLRPRTKSGGSPQRFCSNACQQVAKRRT